MAKNLNDIEYAIQNLENFIESAKYAKFSSQTKIVINKDDIEYYISEIRNKIPEEVELCRKIISNKEAIEKEAYAKADAMLDEVSNKTNQLLSENEIMRRANEEADQIVETAIAQAQKIIEDAQYESENYKESARQYLNDMLINLHDLIYDCVDNTAKNTNKFLESLNQVGLTVSSNLSELNGEAEEPKDEEEEAEEKLANLAEETGSTEE